jgi:hypothetical protein
MSGKLELCQKTVELSRDQPHRRHSNDAPMFRNTRFRRATTRTFLVVLGMGGTVSRDALHAHQLSPKSSKTKHRVIVLIKTAAWSNAACSQKTSLDLMHSND